MKVFLSWSGLLSQRVASALKEYLPLMIQDLNVFMSKHDIESGSRWSKELARELADSSFGVLCLTPDNLESPWLLFEAGALTKHVDGRACGLLIGSLKPTEVSGPLAQFQHRSFSKDELHALLKDLNSMLPNSLAESQLRSIFEKWWSDIDNAYNAAIADAGGESPRAPRDQRDLLEEVLTRIRVIEHAVQPVEPESLSMYSLGASFRRAHDNLTDRQQQMLADIANAAEAVPIDQFSSEDLGNLVKTGLVHCSDAGVTIHGLVAQALSKSVGS
jgi:hypothetical protein